MDIRTVYNALEKAKKWGVKKINRRYEFNEFIEKIIYYAIPPKEIPVVDYNEISSEIDALWPKQRNTIQRTLEKSLIENFVKNGEVFLRLKNAIEVKVRISPTKLPPLYVFIGQFFEDIPQQD